MTRIWKLGTKLTKIVFDENEIRECRNYPVSIDSVWYDNKIWQNPFFVKKIPLIEDLGSTYLSN